MGIAKFRHYEHLTLPSSPVRLEVRDIAQGMWLLSHSPVPCPWPLIIQYDWKGEISHKVCGCCRTVLCCVRVTGGRYI